MWSGKQERGREREQCLGHETGEGDLEVSKRDN